MQKGEPTNYLQGFLYNKYMTPYRESSEQKRNREINKTHSHTRGKTQKRKWKECILGV